MIGKVVRGTDAGRLLYYLFGPGRANGHTDPHLVAGFSDPAELEPERRPNGSRDLRRLSGLLAQPIAANSGPNYDRPVWHCSVRAAPGDRVLSDEEWAQVAAGIMDRTGLAPKDDELGVRWVAVRHAPDHIHIVPSRSRPPGGAGRKRHASHCAVRSAPRRPGRARSTAAQRPGHDWFTAPRRNAAYAHAGREAQAAADYIRHCAGTDPARAADAAWAAADALHVAGRTLRIPALRCAADTYDRAARVPCGRLPRCTHAGDRLRLAARLIAMIGPDDQPGQVGELLISVASLGIACRRCR